MDVNSTKDFLLSPMGRSLALLVRAFLSAVFICGGFQLFDLKNMFPLFAKKKIVGVFLVILGSRMLIDVIFFFDLT